MKMLNIMKYTWNILLDSKSLYMSSPFLAMMPALPDLDQAKNEVRTRGGRAAVLQPEWPGMMTASVQRPKVDWHVPDAVASSDALCHSLSCRPILALSLCAGLAPHSWLALHWNSVPSAQCGAILEVGHHSCCPTLTCQLEGELTIQP